jgi:hypothetical protein
LLHLNPWQIVQDPLCTDFLNFQLSINIAWIVHDAISTSREGVMCVHYWPITNKARTVTTYLSSIIVTTHLACGLCPLPLPLWKPILLWCGMVWQLLVHRNHAVLCDTDLHFPLMQPGFWWSKVLCVYWTFFMTV